MWSLKIILSLLASLTFLISRDKIYWRYWFYVDLLYDYWLSIVDVGESNHCTRLTLQFSWKINQQRGVYILEGSLANISKQTDKI